MRHTALVVNAELAKRDGAKALLPAYSLMSRLLTSFLSICREYEYCHHSQGGDGSLRNTDHRCHPL